MTYRSPLRWTSSACTDVGAVRELNEDAYLERPDLGLWLVADGMGGHFAGDVASQMVVSAMDGLEVPRTLSEFADLVEKRLVETNTKLREYAEREETHTIGSTVVALLVYREHAVCLWAGDSRMYRLRGGELQQISQDHALVEELVERGVLTPEQAIDHPHGNLVTRAVGAADQLFIDVEIIPVQAGDLFILCSDGLEKEVVEEEVSIPARDGDPSQLSHALLERALAYGARDNVTVISVAIHGEPVNDTSDDAVDGPNDDTVEKDPDTARNDQLPPI
jgi:serine/threonine protein phosphatase PrpC